MGAGASATTGAGVCAGTGCKEHVRIAPPGVIVQKRRYPRHVRHLYKQRYAQKLLKESMNVPEPNTEAAVMLPYPDPDSTVVMVPWPPGERPVLAVNDSEEVPIVEEEDVSTSAPTSPRSELSSVVEVLDATDLLF